MLFVGCRSVLGVVRLRVLFVVCCLLVFWLVLTFCCFFSCRSLVVIRCLSLVDGRLFICLLFCVVLRRVALLCVVWLCVVCCLLFVVRCSFGVCLLRLCVMLVVAFGVVCYCWLWSCFGCVLCVLFVLLCVWFGCGVLAFCVR